MLTAWHEAGHAIVAINVPESDPVHKATIIPRGRALGMVMQLPEGDRLLDELHADDIASRCDDGWARRRRAEVWQGQSHVRRFVRYQRRDLARPQHGHALGLFRRAGPRRVRRSNEEVFVGMQMGRQQAISSDTAKKIDAEVRRLVEDGYNEAKRILTEKAEDHRRLSEALLEYESLTGEEIAAVLRGEKLNRPEDQPAPPSPPAPALPVTDEEPIHPGAWPGAAPQGA